RSCVPENQVRSGVALFVGATPSSMASSLCLASRNRSSAWRASGENRKVFVPLGCVTIPKGSKPSASRCPAVGTERVRISRSGEGSIGNLAFLATSRVSLPRARRMHDQRTLNPRVVDGPQTRIALAEFVAHGAAGLGDVGGLRLCRHLCFPLS